MSDTSFRQNEESWIREIAQNIIEEYFIKLKKDTNSQTERNHHQIKSTLQ